MTKLRRHWQTILITSAIVLVAGGWLWRTAEARIAQQDPPGYTTVSDVRHDAIRNMMTDISLDREALIALNVSSYQAESVLSAVRSWQGNNEATLASVNGTINEKTTLVRTIERAIRMGPFSAEHASQLAVARQDLATAKASYQTALASLKTSVGQLLTESQRATWTAIQSGHGRKMPIRMLALTGAQRLAFSDAQHRFRRQRAAASTPSERTAARSTWQNALGGILTNDQKTVVASYDSNFATASANVSDAFDLVLATDEG